MLKSGAASGDADMHEAALTVTDRTGADPAVAYLMQRLAAFDSRLLEWIRIYPMTPRQHEPLLSGEPPPLTLSTCWLPRERHSGSQPLLSRHRYRIKVNIWQDGGYPATEQGWGRVPARLLQQRNPGKGFTTRGLCEWRYPDRLCATVHALARAIFVFLADTRQVGQNPCESNASAWGHLWTIAWLKQNGQTAAAAALSAQLVQWSIIQTSKR